jgi:hypothetical protein
MHIEAANHIADAVVRLGIYLIRVILQLALIE